MTVIKLAKIITGNLSPDTSLRKMYDVGSYSFSKESSTRKMVNFQLGGGVKNDSFSSCLERVMSSHLIEIF